MWLLFVSRFSHLHVWLAIQLLRQYAEPSDVAQSLVGANQWTRPVQARCAPSEATLVRPVRLFIGFTSHLYPEMKRDYFSLSSEFFHPSRFLFSRCLYL
jgi:hypothetical protein